MEKILSIEQQIAEVLNIYNKLKWNKIQKGIYRICGELEFKVSSPEIMRGKYQIEIIVTKKFPNKLPIVKEIGENIPKDFHKNSNEILCLGVETEIKIFLQNNPNLLDFINSFVIPYLYSFKVWQITGKFPFGERSHEIKGIVEFYKEYLLLNDIQGILNILTYAYKNKKINKYHRCPCGSGKNIYECYHYSQLKQLSTINIKDDLICLYLYCKRKKEKSKNILYPLINNEFERIYNIKTNSSK